MKEASLQEDNSKTKQKKRAPKKISESYLHNAGLYYLERFAASSNHFKRVMMRKIDKSCYHHKDQSREDCIILLNKVTVKFQELGLLNDDSYTKAMVHTFRRRGLSARMIHAKLREKGLSADIIEKALNDYAEQLPDNADLLSGLRLARRKKIGPFTRPDEETNNEKALAILARAGYSYDICQKIIEMDDEQLQQLSEAVDH